MYHNVSWDFIFKIEVYEFDILFLWSIFQVLYISKVVHSFKSRQENSPIRKMSFILVLVSRINNVKVLSENLWIWTLPKSTGLGEWFSCANFAQLANLHSLGFPWQSSIQNPKCFNILYCILQTKTQWIEVPHFKDITTQTLVFHRTLVITVQSSNQTYRIMLPLKGMILNLIT